METSALASVDAYIEDHLEKALHDLSRLVGQPSISSQNMGMRECADLVARLTALEQPASPVAEPVPREHARRARWVRPELVGEVEYRSVTLDRRLRHTAWRGLRSDKDPAQVRFG